MMKTIYKQYFAFVATMLFAITMPAQELPLLPADPAIRQGTLPNGMTYYIASDPSSKGSADFALVQKTGCRTDGDSTAADAIAAARNALAYAPRMGGRSPQAFMVSHGAAAGDKGFVEVTDDATVFRFPGIRLSDGKSVLDSALLVIMDMTERGSWTEDPYVMKWYAPSDQAVIVSGDIDAGSVADKLKMLSYMTPAKPSAARKEYLWKSSPVPHVRTMPSSADSISAVSMSWRSARPPRIYMNTVQPETFGMAMHSLGDISCRRIRKSLKEAGIPAADVVYGYQDASSSPYEEIFKVTAYVPSAYAETVLHTIAGVMASLDGAGASAGEYRLARSEYSEYLHQKSLDPDMPDAGYTDRCVAAFLYNAPLSSAADRLRYHYSRNLPDTTGVRLFNDIVSALLDGRKDLEVSCTDVRDSVGFISRLDSVWTAAASEQSVNSAAPNLRDTVPFPGPGPKVRIKSARKDHLTGGTAWTFSNGFKVVYRHMPSSGRIYYNLALNGGYGSVPDLSAGEGAYFSDYLGLCHVAGLKGEDFMNILASEGISMQSEVNLSNMLLSGYAPDDKAGLLMKALIALAKERRPDPEAFDYYMECDRLALKYAAGTEQARLTAIDSIICPGYIYSSYRSPGKLTPSFAAKAEKFYSEQFEKMNDGVLAIAGDIGEEQLKKILLEYVGAFPTKESAFRRPVLRYQPVSGWSTYTVGGAASTVDVVMSARMPLTADNYASAAVATRILEQRLVEKGAASGLCMKVSYNCMIYPEERLNIFVSSSAAPEDGFAAGFRALDPIEALGVIRSVLSDMASAEIDGGRLAACKAALKNEKSQAMNTPRYWTDAIALRYLDGKDLTTGYMAKLDAVNADDVKNVLGMLEAGSKVEYVIKGK